jgi:hypothetical protein
MQASADDKKYAQDTRLFKDAVIQDSIFKKFESSPLIDQVTMKEICIYAPGDLNKIGKEGKTSWDSFSYAIMMGHNVWMHCNAVQEANRQYDLGNVPSMLVQERFDRLFFKDVVEAIFSTSDKATADKVVEEYSRFWMSIIGTRGATGKKTVNASTKFAELFDETEEETVQSDHDDVFTEDETAILDQMEEQVKNEA